MVLTWIFVQWGRIFWEQTTNPRNHGCIYIRITQLTILLRANLPFDGSDLPKSFMVGDTPHTLNQLNLPYCLRTEDLVEELQWILGQEEEQIVVMPRPKVTPSFRASSGWVEFTTNSIKWPQWWSNWQFIWINFCRHGSSLLFFASFYFCLF